MLLGLSIGFLFIRTVGGLQAEGMTSEICLHVSSSVIHQKVPKIQLDLMQ